MSESAISRLKRFNARLKRLSWTKVRRRARRIVYQFAEDRIYRVPVEEALEFEEVPEFHFDSWDDLQTYVPGPGESREALLTLWRDRLDAGEHVYTRIENGSLAIYGWMIERQSSCFLTDVRQRIEMPDAPAVTYDFFMAPEFRNRDFYPQLLMHSLRHTAAKVPGIQWVYMCVRADDTVPRWWVERLGAHYYESYFYRRVLWREEKWHERPQHDV
jgi:hypothetical protein